VVSICFYFQVHQPFRLGKYSLFDIGKNPSYFDDSKNREVFDKIAKKCYLPMNNLLLDLIHQHKDKFRFTFSFSGTAMEQFEKYSPDILQSFKNLVDTGNVEILGETYYHSLAWLYSKKEFKEQIKMHSDKVKKLFGVKPSVFRNTELIYNNEIAKFAEDLGYKAVLAEGWDNILGWRSPNFIYRPKGCSRIKLMLKNYKLSDDVAFRFSDKGWAEYPLNAEKYSQWINANNGNGNVVNLFMDYETFGEHQWEDTGIFNFMRMLPDELLKNNDNGFLAISDAVKKYSCVGEVDVPHLLSWADVERDISAWTGNRMQQSAMKRLYDMEAAVKRCGSKELLESWRKLTTSDHFYYMCTKWFADGDVHKYFNPYDNPYDCFIIFMNVLNDLNARIEHCRGRKSIKNLFGLLNKTKY